MVGALCDGEGAKSRVSVCARVCMCMCMCMCACVRVYCGDGDDGGDVEVAGYLGAQDPGARVAVVADALERPVQVEALCGGKRREREWD